MRLRDAPWAPNKKIIVAKGEKMKMSLDCRVLLGCALLVFALSPRPAHAALQYAYWDFQVTEMEIVNDGTNNAVAVRGTFTPALPCPVQGFVYFPSDPLQKEVTSLLLTAKATGRTMSYVHVYCFTTGFWNGYSRGNGLVIK